MSDDDRIQKAADTAREIMTLSRNTLLVNLRFLDEALFRLALTPAPVTFATDGEHLFFGAEHVLREYLGDRNAVTRAYLHIVLHCVFRHAFVNTLVDTELWDIAADIAAESMLLSMNLRCSETLQQVKRQKIVDELSKTVKTMTAEKLYRYYLDVGVSQGQRDNLRALFFADDHTVWYERSSPDVPTGSGQGDGDGQGNSDGKNKNKSDGDGEDQGQGQGQSEDQGQGQGQSEGQGQGEGQGDGQSNGDASGKLDSALNEAYARAQLEQDWKNISERMQTDMETTSKAQGDKAGGMMQQLRGLNREHYDYTAFLKKFAVMGETMKVNDDEFDYIFYTYGLKLFGNMPLIEPLEYIEVKRIREFVIAIDTSGSTSGELVQKFLQKTYNILKNTESFFSKINLHIIQCDAAIQEAVKITSREEMDEYLKTLNIKGLGGTDFRPVFSYVDELIAKHEFSNLKGLVYFTDGYGIFPERKPGHETAFVFLREGYDIPGVPPWAIKLILEKDEI